MCVCVWACDINTSEGGGGGVMVCLRQELLDGDHLKSYNVRAEVSKIEECRETGECRAQGAVNLAAERSPSLGGGVI